MNGPYRGFEYSEDAVPSSINYATSVCFGLLSKDGAILVEGRHRRRFVVVHKARVTCGVSRQDCRKPLLSFGFGHCRPQRCPGRAFTLVTMIRDGSGARNASVRSESQSRGSASVAGGAKIDNIDRFGRESG